MDKSVKWTVNLFINVFATMVIIYLIKKVSNKYDIPIVKQVAEGV